MLKPMQKCLKMQGGYREGSSMSTREAKSCLESGPIVFSLINKGRKLFSSLSNDEANWTSWREFGLTEDILSSLEKEGFRKPWPIQSKVLLVSSIHLSLSCPIGFRILFKKLKSHSGFCARWQWKDTCIPSLFAQSSKRRAVPHIDCQ